MHNQDFTTKITVPQSLHEAFHTIKDVRKWWTGLYSEEIEGETDNIGDEFSFRAGGGAHYSKQKLIELLPDKKIVWEVIDSNLSFLENNSEWVGTKLIFEFAEQDNKTEITFRHDGLTPNIECYNNCSAAWQLYLSSYLKNIEQKFNN